MQANSTCLNHRTTNLSHDSIGVLTLKFCNWTPKLKVIFTIRCSSHKIDITDEKKEWVNLLIKRVLRCTWGRVGTGPEQPRHRIEDISSSSDKSLQRSQSHLKYQIIYHISQSHSRHFYNNKHKTFLTISTKLDMAISEIKLLGTIENV